MKILILNHFFQPDVSAVAQLATDLAEDLVLAGHEVTVICARGAYLGGLPLTPSESWRGVKVVRLSATRFGKKLLLGRVADYFTFFAAAAVKALRLPRHDVVLATTSPPLIATIGALLRVVKRTPFVYWLQDVYPELAIEFGILGRRSLMSLGFLGISFATLRQADGIVALGGAMVDRLRKKGIPPERIHLIPNWADGRNVYPIGHQENAFRKTNGLRNKKVVLYSGNMGRGHDIETILGAARRMRHDVDLVFAFIGDGAKLDLVKAASREMTSVRTFPYQSRENLAQSLSAGDIHVVTMDPCTLGLLEPSKLYGVLAVGRPTLFIGPADSEVARTVILERVGEVVANGDVDATVAAIGRLLASAEATGGHARSAFERAYDRSFRTSSFRKLLEEVSNC